MARTGSAVGPRPLIFQRTNQVSLELQRHFLENAPSLKLRELEAWVAASVKGMGQLDIALIRPGLWGWMVLLSDVPKL